MNPQDRLLLYQESEQYKMLELLHCFRKGLNISSDSIAQQLNYSPSAIRLFERGKVKMREELLRKYASLIAEEMEFEVDAFYCSLHQETCQIQDNSSCHMLNAVMQITDSLSAISSEKQGKRNLSFPFHQPVKNKSIPLLGCIRRVIGIPAREFFPATGERITSLELGSEYASLELFKKYAKEIANRIGYDNGEYFLERILYESEQVNYASSSALVSVMKAAARVVVDCKKMK